MKRRLIVALAILAMAVSVIAAYRTESAGGSFSISETTAASKPLEMHGPGEHPAGAQGEPIEGELITIHPHGFEPKEIKRPPGRFLIAVDNRSGLEEEIALRLDHVGGSRLREIQMASNRLDWRDLIDLPPGHYTLREVNHPDWACLIVIDSR